MKFLKKLVLSAFFASSVLATSANAADCKARLGDFDWSSANIHTAIALLFLKKDMGVKCLLQKEVLHRSWLHTTISS